MANYTESASDPTPGESCVAAWSSSNHDAEMESMSIKGLLDANGIPAMVIGPQVLPNLEFQVQVPEHMLTEAEQVIREARRIGRQAATEAEAATE
jgi:uridine phosphorylase